MVVAQAVGVAVEVEHHGAVQESVEHCGGDGGVAEDLSPGPDASVGSQDDRGLGVALGDDLEQGRCRFSGQREVLGRGRDAVRPFGRRFSNKQPLGSLNESWWSSALDQGVSARLSDLGVRE